MLKINRSVTLELDEEVEEEWEEEAYPEDEYDDEYEDEEETFEEVEMTKTNARRTSQENVESYLFELLLQGKAATDDDIPRPDNFEGYIFPSLELLDDSEDGYSNSIEDLVRDQAASLEETLQMYGIDGEVASIEAGPTITLYSINLAPWHKSFVNQYCRK